MLHSSSPSSIHASPKSIHSSPKSIHSSPRQSSSPRNKYGSQHQLSSSQNYSQQGSRYSRLDPISTLLPCSKNELPSLHSPPSSPSQTTSSNSPLRSPLRSPLASPTTRVSTKSNTPSNTNPLNTTPKKPAKSISYTDRHIPSRGAGIHLQAAFSLAVTDKSSIYAPNTTQNSSHRRGRRRAGGTNGAQEEDEDEAFGGPLVNNAAATFLPGLPLLHGAGTTGGTGGAGGNQDTVIEPGFWTNNRLSPQDPLIASPPAFTSPSVFPRLGSLSPSHSPLNSPGLESSSAALDSSTAQQDPNLVQQQLKLANETYNALLKNELFGLSVPNSNTISNNTYSNGGSSGSSSSARNNTHGMSLSEVSSSTLNKPAAISVPRCYDNGGAEQRNMNIFRYKASNARKEVISYGTVSTPGSVRSDSERARRRRRSTEYEPSHEFSFESSRVYDYEPPRSPGNGNADTGDTLLPLPATPAHARAASLPFLGPNPLDPVYTSYTSTISPDSQRLLAQRSVITRLIPRTPYSVLDAPDLADDFYLNLIDWGSQNLLAVALGAKVYIWDAVTTNVTCLCDLNEPGSSANSPLDDMVTSVSWIKRGTHLAIGTRSGTVQIWDTLRCRRVRCMTGHTKRVGALSWNDHILTSGSRDRSIVHRDVRVAEHYTSKLDNAHKQEVCGLKWCNEASGGRGLLASGGNDNKLAIWDAAMVGGGHSGGHNSASTMGSSSSAGLGGIQSGSKPLYRFSDHKAAVKALAWSPHSRNLLASGGGTADRRIRFWDTKNGTCVQEIDTGSQVCALAWSQFSSSGGGSAANGGTPATASTQELISSHGYSQNAIVVWKYPTMKQTSVLTGHTSRVLYMALSPDGKSLATGAGDETLRFWNLWGDRNGNEKWYKNDSVLDVFPKLR